MTTTPKGLRTQKVLSALTIAAGLALMTFMIIVESEPGAIPLLLVALGTGWHLATRSRSRQG